LRSGVWRILRTVRARWVGPPSGLDRVGFLIRHPVPLTATSFASMFTLGVSITIVGAAARNIGLRPAEIGYLVAAQNIGFLVSVATVGLLSDRYSKTLLLACGSAMLAGSVGVFYATETLWVNVIVIFLIGVTVGTYEGATDPLLLDLHPRHQHLLVNINHFFVSAGAVAITAYYLLLQMEWRRSMIQLAVSAGVLAVIHAFSRIENERPALPLRHLGRLGKQRIIGSLFLAELCALGLIVGTTGILTSFVMEQRGFDQVESKIALILFLGGIAAGRIVFIPFSRRRGVVELVPFLFALSCVLFSLFYFVELSRLPTYLLLALCGAATSPLIPIQISLAGTIFHETPGTAMGIVKVALPSGGIVVPLAISLVTEVASFQVAPLLFPTIALVGLIAFLISRREILRRVASLR